VYARLWHLLQECLQDLAGLCTGGLRQSLFLGVVHPDLTTLTAQNQPNLLNEIRSGFLQKKPFNASNQVGDHVYYYRNKTDIQHRNFSGTTITRTRARSLSTVSHLLPCSNSPSFIRVIDSVLNNKLRRFSCYQFLCPLESFSLQVLHNRCRIYPTLKVEGMRQV
jgi:hypothetical protein